MDYMLLIVFQVVMKPYYGSQKRMIIFSILTMSGVPAKYPGKLHFKGDKKGLPSGNPLGKNPSDIWEIVVKDWENELWDIPNVKSNHPEKSDHPCQFPLN